MNFIISTITLTQIRILLNISVMSSSNVSESPQAMSDPLTRVYVCFCQKRFTTYPGIYLHLKSKHSHLFENYKNLKITKLFKKMQDAKGSEVYKLQRISEIDSLGSQFCYKKIKENKINKSRHSDLSLPEPKPHTKFTLPRHSTTNQDIAGQTQLDRPSSTSSLHFPPLNLYPPGSHPNNYSFRVWPNFGASFGEYAMPARMHFGQTNLTIKKILENFLLSSAQEEQAIVKVAMYDLMVYIDKNSDSLNDPRIRERVFLSYCEQCDPRFTKPLLLEYIKKLSDQARDAPEETTKVVLHRKIDYLVKLFIRLGEMGLIDFPLKSCLTTAVIKPVPTVDSQHSSQEKLGTPIDHPQSTRF